MRNFIPEEGCSLYEAPSTHTFSLCRLVDKFTFSNVYYRIQSGHLPTNIKYDKKLLAKFSGNYDNFPIDEKTHTIKHKFPSVPIAYGVSMQLSFCKTITNYNKVKVNKEKTKLEYVESLYITLIVNPNLLIESHTQNFDAITYDYLKIAPREFWFWRDFDKYYSDILRQWGLGSDFKSGCTKRIDASCTIKIPKYFNKVRYLEYLSKLPRQNYYHEAHFYHDNQNEHQSMAISKSKAVTFYDKNFEQAIKFSNYIEDQYIRIECQFFGSAFTDILYSYIRKGYLKSFDKVHTALWIKLFLFSNMAPYIILDYLNRVFPTGDILEINRAEKRIEKPKRWCEHNLQDNTKDDLKFILRMFSKSQSFDDSYKIKRKLCSMYGNTKYYRLNSLLKELQISPITIPRNVATSDHTKYPSPRNLYLSALINSFDMINTLDPIFYVEKYPSLDELMNTLN